MRVLPAGMRDPIGLAYLLARAADTIADTSLIAPGPRMELLLSLRNQVNGAPDEAALMRMAAEVGSQQAESDEKVLLESLGAALTVLSQVSESDREAMRDNVSTLTKGMEFDLHTFPDESSGRIVALREFSELEQYTYMVAGCVGEFWTKMTYAHVPGAFIQQILVMYVGGIHRSQYRSANPTYGLLTIESTSCYRFSKRLGLVAL